MRIALFRGCLGSLLTVCIVLATATAPASAAGITKVCKQATLSSSSGTNLTKIRVRRGDRVIVVERRGRKTYAIAHRGQGWMPTRSLCAKKRKSHRR